MSNNAFQSPQEYADTLDDLVATFRRMFKARPETRAACSRDDLVALGMAMTYLAHHEVNRPLSCYAGVNTRG